MALTDQQIYDLLKQLPDFDRLPLPKYFYEKFNIPPPEILTPMEALKLHNKTAYAPGPYCELEVREPAPGGVRPILESEPLKIETITDEAPVDQESPSSTQVCCDLSGSRQDTQG